MSAHDKRLLKIVGLVVAGAIVAGIAVRDLAVLASPQGRCMVPVQPSVLIGASPSFMTDLACA